MFLQLSVCPQGGVHGRGGHAWQGTCMAGGHAWQGHAWQILRDTVRAGGTHTTGMHSCSMVNFLCMITTNVRLSFVHLMNFHVYSSNDENYSNVLTCKRSVDRFEVCIALQRFSPIHWRTERSLKGILGASLQIHVLWTFFCNSAFRQANGRTVQGFD